jgi:hypothetical protein
MIESLRHENVSSALECFCFKNILYAIGDFYPLTLGHIVACKAFPTEPQLNAFMVQVDINCLFEVLKVDFANCW